MASHYFPMLLIPTRLAPSPIHGIGLFAMADIAKDTMVWRWDDTIDHEVPWKKTDPLPEVAQQFLNTYPYRNIEKKTWMLPGDDARFINHSSDPNTISGGPYGPDYATRDIKAGEELTINYQAFDPDFEEYAADLR